jgi:gliding motility-associated-like protein
MNETDYLVTWKKGEEHKISLTVSNRESCQSFAEVTLKLPPQPEAFFDQQIAESEPPSMVYFTNHSTLSGQKDDGKDMSYFWDFGDGNYSEEMHPEHLYTTSGVYSVKLIARDHMGCGDTITGEPVRIKSRSVHNQSRYFSPNGDGINDVFKVNNPDLTEFTVSIMMNNGEVIFQWNQPEEGWNGKLPGGNYAAQGLYYYIIRGKDISGRLVEIPGTVYLVKE